MDNCIVLSAVILISLISTVTCRIHNDPEYDYIFIGDKDCVPYNGTTVSAAREWNKRVYNMTDPGSQLYGYVRVKENGAPYDNPCNCAVKLLAPPGYKIVMRIPRIEIYHDENGCHKDKVSLIGDSPEPLEYCGFGAVGYSIISTTEWVIIRITATPWDEYHNYIGVSLYFTALHNAPCNQNSNTTYEFGCNNHCIPQEVTCDDRDNCGDWDDERSRVCGLTEGAIIAISIVCVLVGGALLFFLMYCLYNKHKDKRRERERRQAVNPTMRVGSSATGGNVTIVPSDPGFTSSGAEPPPPYTPEAYHNMGLYTGDEQGNGDIPPPGETDGNYESLNPPPIGTEAVNMRVTRASNMRPAMGEPPPLYTIQNPGSEGAAQGPLTGAGATGSVAGAAGGSEGVSFEQLPHKDKK